MIAYNESSDFLTATPYSPRKKDYVVIYKSTKPDDLSGMKDYQELGNDFKKIEFTFVFSLKNLGFHIMIHKDKKAEIEEEIKQALASK